MAEKDQWEDYILDCHVASLLKIMASQILFPSCCLTQGLHHLPS